MEGSSSLHISILPNLVATEIRMISQDHVIIWSCNFMGSAPFKLSHHSARFCGNRRCGSRKVMIYGCHMISQDHLIQGSFDVMDGTPLW